MSQSTSLFPDKAGSASSLISAAGMGFAAVSGLIVHYISHGDVTRLASLMLIVSSVGIIVYYLLSKQALTFRRGVNNG